MTFTLYQLAGLAGIVLCLVFSMVCFSFVQNSLWRVIEQDRKIIAAQAAQIALLTVSIPTSALEELFNLKGGK